MKSTINRLFLFAAAALSLGTAAFGQEAMTANVPFAFGVATGNASAGRYTVRIQMNGSGYTAEVTDRATGHGIVTFTNRLDHRSSAANTPRLVFRCADTSCRLAEIWTLTGGFGVPVHHVRAPEYTVSIPFTVAGD